MVPLFFANYNQVVFPVLHLFLKIVIWLVSFDTKGFGQDSEPDIRIIYSCFQITISARNQKSRFVI